MLDIKYFIRAIINCDGDSKVSKGYPTIEHFIQKVFN